MHFLIGFLSTTKLGNKLSPVSGEIYRSAEPFAFQLCFQPLTNYFFQFVPNKILFGSKLNSLGYVKLDLENIGCLRKYEKITELPCWT